MPLATAFVPLWNRAAEWERRLAMIRDARTFLYLSAFYIEYDAYGKELIAALLDAQRRGVAVNLLIDGFGQRLGGVLMSAAQRLELTREQSALRAAGGIVTFYRPSRPLQRMLGGDVDGATQAGRGEKLMPALAECLNEVGVKGGDIARVVCGAGPGSFTSLRVAGSVAKGLAVGYGVDLFAVSSLLLTVTGAGPELPPGEYLSVLDAMRGEFYGQRLELRPDRTAIETAAMALFTADELTALAAREPRIRIIGPGRGLDFHPRAAGVAPMLDSIVEGGPVDLASWEPEYGRLAEAQVRWEAEHGRALPR